VGEGGKGGGGSKGGEMTQTLYAHMNKRKKKNLPAELSCYIILDPQKLR
jgi:hypothetical protein